MDVAALNVLYVSESLWLCILLKFVLFLLRIFYISGKKFGKKQINLEKNGYEWNADFFIKMTGNWFYFIIITQKNII